MTSKHKLTHNPFEAVKGSFEFGDMIVWALVSSLSMNKARRFGWTGYVDTMEGLFMAYDEMSRIGMLPPMVVERAEPLI